MSSRTWCKIAAGAAGAGLIFTLEGRQPEPWWVVAALWLAVLAMSLVALRRGKRAETTGETS